MVSPHEAQALPPLPLGEWEDTKETLLPLLPDSWQGADGMLALQKPLVARNALRHHPRAHHRLHTLRPENLRHLLGPDREQAGRDHQRGRRILFRLDDLPVAEFYRRLFEGLGALGINVSINTNPFDLEDDHSLDNNTYHCTFNGELFRCFHRALVQVDQVFEDFAGRVNGKTSPVQLFWHSFDLAVTRFSGKRVSLPEDTDPVTRRPIRTRSYPSGSGPETATCASRPSTPTSRPSQRA